MTLEKARRLLLIVPPSLGVVAFVKETPADSLPAKSTKVKTEGLRGPLKGPPHTPISPGPVVSPAPAGASAAALSPAAVVAAAAVAAGDSRTRRTA